MIFIPYNTPSSKNSRINTRSGSFFSPQVRRYLQKLGVKAFSSSKQKVETYKTRPNIFAEIVGRVNWSGYKPLILGYHPVRDSKRRFDLQNCFQIVGDLRQAHGVIEDDRAEFLIPIAMKMQGEYYSLDKENPGIYLKILNGETVEY